MPIRQTWGRSRLCQYIFQATKYNTARVHAFRPQKARPDIFYLFLHVMNANPSTYGAALLGALCASGFVSHFLIDQDTLLTLRRQTLRHRHGAVYHISEAFPERWNVTEGSGTFVGFLLYTEFGPNLHL